MALVFRPPATIPSDVTASVAHIVTTGPSTAVANVTVYGRYAAWTELMTTALGIANASGAPSYQATVVNVTGRFHRKIGRCMRPKSLVDLHNALMRVS